MASSGLPSNSTFQMNDGHAAAEIEDILHDMRGENHDHLLANLGQQIVKTIALARIETGRGLVYDQQMRIPDERLRDAESLTHPSRETGQRLLAHLVEIASPQHRFHHVLALARVGDALEQRDVGEHVLRRNARIDAEVLRQISKPPPHLVLLPQHIDLAQADAAGVGLLQGSESSHQGGLARAVRSQQAIHATRDFQRDIVERLHPVGIGL